MHDKMLCDRYGNTFGLVIGIHPHHMAALAATRSPRDDDLPCASGLPITQRAAHHFSMKDASGTGPASRGFSGSGIAEGMPERHEQQP
jgi:hypothetical protein